MRWLTGLLVVVGFMACPNGHEIEKSDYRTDCTVDGDCVGVFIGDPCPNACRCPTDAINKQDWEKHSDDVQSYACVALSPIMKCDCEDTHAVCEQGTCQLKSGLPVDAGQ